MAHGRGAIDICSCLGQEEKQGAGGNWKSVGSLGIACERPFCLSWGLFGRVGAQPALGAECVAVCWVGWGLSTCVSLCLRCLQRKCEPVKTGGRVSL